MTTPLPRWPLALLILAATLSPGCGRAPSMGPDKAAFAAIDALYSAVSLKDPAQLSRNEATLNDLHSSGRLPDAAHKALSPIISTARSGEWETARQRLRDFMLDQRGDRG